MHFSSLFSNMMVTCMPIVCYNILTLCRKCLLFQFRIRSISIRISILTEVQKDTLATKKMVIFSQKTYFWSLIFNIKVTCMPIACFIFWVFFVNAFFSVLTFWHTYAHFRSNNGSKKDNLVVKEMVMFCKKMWK